MSTYPSIADQMWCLARLLPFMVGDIILTDDKHWLDFLAFLTIIDYVFGPVVSPGIVTFLHDKICSHHISTAVPRVFHNSKVSLHDPYSQMDSEA